ncbi:HAMP domain-containing protein [Alphaproteobacteria bacterium HT1-32]|nr:HAMP domain-containing protein [Alphaproteobacteria bacterium HT1-32]
MKWLTPFWPKRMASQMIALVIAGFVLSQIIVLIAITLDRRESLREFESARLLDRLAVTVRIIENAPPSLGRQLTAATSSNFLTFWVTRTPVLQEGIMDSDRDWHDVDERIRSLKQRIGQNRDIRFGDKDRLLRSARLPREIRSGKDDDDDDDRKRFREGDRFRPDLVLSIGLRDGRWLNAGLNHRQHVGRIGFPILLSFLITGSVLALVVILAVRRVTRPLEHLSGAADRMGRGETVSPIAEAGPADLRETIRAFNQMQDRLHRMMTDRTRMLAALGHDLRTPITSLKLQTEFIEDDDLRDRMQRQLNDMHQMAESALNFARDASDGEAARQTDITALVESLIDDMEGINTAVSFVGETRITTRCRPVALGRAIRNLIQNAVNYGGQAIVDVSDAGDHIEITIDDNGPGIPEADLARVFDAFERLDDARNKDSGGTGLGLTIARTIARSHGGDVTLTNREAGGLRARITLPATNPS